MEKEFIFENPLGLDGVIVKLETAGQVAINEGNEVMVRATIAFPVEPDTSDPWYIHPKYQAEHRVAIFGEYLACDWGDRNKITYHGQPVSDDESPWYRTSERYYRETTYREAFITARKGVFDELTSLANLLEERKKILRDAEASVQNMDVIPRRNTGE